MHITLIGGPTALLELGGLRLLTDPTFDPPGEYPIGDRTLVKTAGPAISADALGAVDAVLLSHDQHPDNLDRLGSKFLATAPTVLSTPAAAHRLGDNTVGLSAWDTHTLKGGLEVTAVPALHGPPGSEPLVGEVTGFVISGPRAPTIYVSGDNASMDLVGEIATRFPDIDVAVLFAGAAKTPLVGDDCLTLTAQQAARATSILAADRVVVIHIDSWEHFTEGADAVTAAFSGRDGFVTLAPGERVEL
jgi:L-ascorbate metabolism protein UlaG (beta-lactamase superfamily)